MQGKGFRLQAQIRKYQAYGHLKTYPKQTFYNKRLFRLFTFIGDILGNIRQSFIKNIAIDLVEKYPDQFKHDDFQHNKRKVAELSDVGSKLLRNRIAGYITRYLSLQNKEKTSSPIYE